MTFYIVTDSDWTWADNEGGSAYPPIVEANDPESAIKLAAEKMQSEGGPGGAFDGATLIVGEIKALGFQMMEKDAEGVLVFDSYTPFHPALLG